MNTFSGTGGRIPLGMRATSKMCFCARGVTLIELMVVVALLGSLAAMAAPSFASLLSATRLRTASDSFFIHLFLARNEAIKRRSRVVICKSESGQACDADSKWEQGWIVFQDVNNNAQLDTGESVVGRQTALVSSVRFAGNQNVDKYISYTPEGRTKLISGAFQAGTFTICRVSSGQAEARQVVINAAGLPRTTKTTVPTCP